MEHRTKWTGNSQHIRTALQHCQFPEWALNQWQHKFTHPNQPNTTNNNNNNNNSPANIKKNITIVVPYMPNTGEKFRKLCKKKGIQAHFKGTNTLRTALGNPKDKDPKSNQTGIIYHYQYPQINCLSAYIGESGRSLGERVKEHFKTPSPIHLHSTTTGHPMYPEQFNIVHKEVNSHSRTIKELCSSACRTQPSTGTLGNTSYCTYGTTSFRHHQPYSASLPAIQWHPTPASPHPSTGSPSPFLPLSILVGAQTFMVSTHVCPKHTLYTPNTPTSNLQQVLQQHHLGKFLYFIC